ncbi:hypothetical protein ACNOYE_33870 [Nannocystaceae bacterium ST9]
MTQASPEPSEREHDDAIASLRALERAATRDWQAVALGERALAEVAAERADAGDDPEAIERAKALFRPYDDLEQRRLLDALLELPNQPAAASAPVVERAPSTNPSRRRGFVVASLVAIAAVLVLGLLSWVESLKPSDADSDPRVAALPAYAIESDGGLALTRSTPNQPRESLRYAGANQFEWLLRPHTDVVGPPPHLAVLARDARGRTTPLAAKLERAESGAIRLSGTIAELGLAPGEWTIEFTLLRASGWQLERTTLALPITVQP